MRRANGAVEVPAVGGLRAYLDADVDGTPRMVVEVNHLEIRFILSYAVLGIETVGAVDRIAATTAEWQQAVRQLATDQRVIPAVSAASAQRATHLRPAPEPRW